MARPSTLTVFVTDRASLGAAPSPQDVPDRSADRRRIVTTSVVAATLVVGGAVGAFALGPGVGRTLCAVGAAVVVALWLLLVRPQLVVLRWDRSFARLAARPERAEGRIAGLELTWDRERTKCSVAGRIAYAGADGSAHELPIAVSSNLTWRLDAAQAPGEDSPVVVWHTPDHAVAQAVVLVGEAATPTA
ncbi:MULTISPECIES: hypothetical protein [unclassified Isoptericola]|uniref:hypothetical protein n=1 Tax=unclassified Isoptericola TaxID=2623355 RepID=UPI00364C3443